MVDTVILDDLIITKSVANVTELNNIPTANLNQGMMVYMISPASIHIWNGSSFDLFLQKAINTEVDAGIDDVKFITSKAAKDSNIAFETENAAFADLSATSLTTTSNSVDGVDIASLKTDVDGFPDELKNLTSVEINQLENIDTTTISSTQWGYVGSSDQDISTSSAPTFSTVKSSLNFESTSSNIFYGANLYYSGGWKYYGDNAGGYIKFNNADLFTIATAPSNAGGAGAAATPVETLFVTAGKAGIGESTPVNTFDVSGGVAVGSSYSGTNLAPTNGMLIEGSVAIGSTTAEKELHVEGSIRIHGGDGGKGATLDWGDPLRKIEYTSDDIMTVQSPKNVSIIIDNNGNNTDAKFIISKDNDDPALSTELFKVTDPGVVSMTGDTFIIETSKTPSSASDTGVKGSIVWDTNYIYVCTATNTWKRTAISTW